MRGDRPLKSGAAADTGILFIAILVVAGAGACVLLIAADALLDAIAPNADAAS